MTISYKSLISILNVVPVVFFIIILLVSVQYTACETKGATFLILN